MKNYDKIKANGDFHRIYNRGKSFVGPMIVTYTAKGRKDRVRLGITATKKLGGAVERNRAKRVITAAFRECLPYIQKGTDMVIVARVRILSVKSTQVAAILRKQLKTAGLWCEDESCE